MVRWPPRCFGRRILDILRRIEGFWLFKLFWSLLLLILRWIEGPVACLWIPLLVFWHLGIIEVFAGVFDIFGIRQLFFAGDPGAHLFLAWLSSSVIFLIPTILLMLRLHAYGTGVTGIALDTWSRTYTETYPVTRTDDFARVYDRRPKSTSTRTIHCTTIRYEVGAKHYTVTVRGRYGAGRQVPLVYNSTYPSTALAERDIEFLATVFCPFPMITGIVILTVTTGPIGFLIPPLVFGGLSFLARTISEAK